MEINDIHRITQIINETISKELRKVMDENARRANCFGVRGNLVEFREQEREDVLIVEERSVAAFDFRDAIQQINEFINWLLQEGRIIDFQIDINNCGNDDLKIDLAKSVVLKIKFANSQEEAEYIQDETIINNGIVEKICIWLLINPFNHNQSLLMQYLYHELNHCKDDIERRLNGKPSLNDKLNGNLAEIKYQEAYNNTMKGDRIATLIYQLFVDTELNAFISQLYGELESYNINRNQFRYYFKNMHSYQVYDGLRWFVEQLEKRVGWEETALYYFNRKFNSPEKFRMWFLDRANDRLKNMFKKLCKVASLYFDTKEAENPN